VRRRELVAPGQDRAVTAECDRNLPMESRLSHHAYVVLGWKRNDGSAFDCQHPTCYWPFLYQALCTHSLRAVELWRLLFGQGPCVARVFPLLLRDSLARRRHRARRLLSFDRRTLFFKLQFRVLEHDEATLSPQ
jgi:hypothetical protein